MDVSSLVSSRSRIVCFDGAAQGNGLWKNETVTLNLGGKSYQYGFAEVHRVVDAHRKLSNNPDVFLSERHLNNAKNA